MSTKSNWAYIKSPQKLFDNSNKFEKKRSMDQEIHKLKENYDILEL